MFRAGEATNVIPDTAELAGTIRDLDQGTFKIIVDAMRRMVEGTAAVYGCESEVRFEEGYAETSNHTANTDIVGRLAGVEPRVMKVSEEGLPLMGTEDFGYYLREKPGCFFIVGTEEERRRGLAALPWEGGEGAKETPGFGWANGMFKCAGVGGFCGPGDGEARGCCARTNCCPHGTAFDFNDNALPFVVAMYLKIVEDRLCKGGFMQGYVDDGATACVM